MIGTAELYFFIVVSVTLNPTQGLRDAKNPVLTKLPMDLKGIW